MVVEVICVVCVDNGGRFQLVHGVEGRDGGVGVVVGLAKFRWTQIS